MRVSEAPARRLTVAIDGPAGAGKSAAAQAVARALGYAYIDSGAMYRAVALRALEDGVGLGCPDRIADLARSARIAFDPGVDGAQRVLLDGRDVTEAIRTPEVTRLSSPVSAIASVRVELAARQQELGRAGGVVMEGRDIGTVVFPMAEVKVFLTASDEERARRRLADRVAAGAPGTLEEVLQEQRERDARDSSRDVAPLRPAEDAVLLNSDGMSLDEVVARILALCRERQQCRW
ncbi:MAG TPA: (d)CMP kinase [Chthonomonadales bacterium]|nr:(d)CMP kinase [Chthonomonadales bacterium]